MSWWNTFYCTNTNIIDPPVNKPGAGKGAILVIDEMDISIEVIETKLDFSIKPIRTEIDIDLKMKTNDLKFDIECL